MSSFSNEYLKQAHKACFCNKHAIRESQECGCFYCERVFDASELKEWVKDRADDTALCPYCGIDAVIGDASGYELSPDFLNAMYHYWFE